MSNATETTVPKSQKKNAGCCGGTKNGEQPVVPTAAADQAKPGSHAAHDHSKHESSAGCCGGGKARK